MTVHTFDTEAAWLDARAKCVSSTESAALFGMSPYLTAYELGVEKQGMLAPAELSKNERVTWGRRLQDAIAQGIADDFKVAIAGQEYVYITHEDEPRMGASFDYWVTAAGDERNALTDLFHEHGPGLLEIKNVDWLIFKDWPLPDAPDHIEIQVQHQLEVAGLEWAIIGVLIGGNRQEIFVRRRDRQVGAAIKKRIHDLWHDREAGVLPSPTMPQDADIVIKLHQYAEPGLVLDAQNDLVLANLCEEYDSARHVAKEAETAQRTLMAKILTHIGDAERALLSEFSVSAGMVAETEVRAYKRPAYRNCRITRKRSGKDKTQSAK